MLKSEPSEFETCSRRTASPTTAMQRAYDCCSFYRRRKNVDGLLPRHWRPVCPFNSVDFLLLRLRCVELLGLCLDGIGCGNVSWMAECTSFNRSHLVVF